MVDSGISKAGAAKVYCGVSFQLGESEVHLSPDTPINEMKTEGFECRLENPVHLSKVEDIFDDVSDTLGAKYNWRSLRDDLAGIPVLEGAVELIGPAMLGIEDFSMKVPATHALESKIKNSEQGKQYTVGLSITWGDDEGTLISNISLKGLLFNIAHDTSKGGSREISLGFKLAIGESTITPSIKMLELNGEAKGEKIRYFEGSLTEEDLSTCKSSGINLKQLMKDFGFELEDTLSDMLDFSIESIKFGWYPEDSAGWFYIETDSLAVALFSRRKPPTNTSRDTVFSITSKSDPLNLAAIMPLVDTQSLPTMQLKNPSITYASSNFDKTINIDQYLPTDIKDAFPTEQDGKLSKQFAAGFSVAVEVALDDLVSPLVLPLQKSTEKHRQKTLTTAASKARPSSNKVVPESSNTSTTIGRSLGPVTVSGFGLAYQEGNVILSLDGALNLSKFQMYLLDMNLNLNVNGLMNGKLDGSGFDLSGLYLDLQATGFSLNGGFLRNEGPDGSDEYLGQLSLKTKVLSLTALGMYSQLHNGDHSLFAYLALNSPIGGDPAFFVEGLALGFGYNRDVLVPPINEVSKFPLVTALNPESQNNKPIPINGASIKDTKSLEIVRDRFAELSKYLPAMSGQYLVCAGLAFNTYKQVDSIAVLMVEFGESLGIHLVGTSEMRLPMGITNAVVAIEMAYRMSFDMAEGVVSLEAQLTDNSYLLSRKCRLTGGFAFYSWFSGENKGNFVVSIGGYHPEFNAPDYYPVVPRLGFSWMVTDNIYFKGEMYAALTPIAIMAGAGVSAHLTCGKVKAWFNADMNFIIYWQPFHYQASFGISIGAEVRLGWKRFGKTFRAELGAHLDIRGPDFSGEAEVHWIIFSFDFEFGSANKEELTPVKWSEFASEHLPEVGTPLLDVNLTKGDREKGDGYFLIDPDNFELTINSVIPRNKVSINNNDSINQAFAIAPMGGSTKAATSDWNINVNVEKDGQLTNQFVIKPDFKRYPKAVWGDDFKPDIKEKGTTIDLLSGLVVTPKATKPPRFTEALDASDFSFTDLKENDPTWQWGEEIIGDICRSSNDNAELIKDTLSNQDVVKQRDKVATFFNLDHTLTVDHMKNNLESAFIGTPLTQSVAL